MYDRGFSLFPLQPNTKSPALKWEPYQTVRAPAPLVATWATGSFNTGVATGAVSGVVVLDCDNLLARIAAESLGIPPTLTITTPRGTHFYFQHPGWVVVNRAGRTWTRDLPGGAVDGWDIRGDGGYVVGPGSYYVPTDDERAKGKVEGAYAVELDAPVAPAPDWLLALLMPRTHKPPVAPKECDETTAYGRAALLDECEKLASVQDHVNDAINMAGWAIGQLVGGGEIRADEAFEALEEVLSGRGLGHEFKANDTLRRSFDQGILQPRGVEHHEPVTPEQALGTRTPANVAPPPPLPSAYTGVRVLTVAEACDLIGPPIRPHMVTADNMHLYFEGCVYVTERDEMFTRGGWFMNRSQFDQVYAGPTFSATIDGSKPHKSAWQMFNQNEHALLPKVLGVVFRPELPPAAIVEIENAPYLNTYVSIRTPRIEGDPSPFVNHVRKMLPDPRDADLLLHWMASCVQNPGAKFQWWPVVQGVKGNGKSLLLDVMTAAIGDRYSHKVRAESLTKTGNQFNDWIVGKLFLGFEEIHSSEGKRDFVEVMKDTVTARRIATEGKGKKQTVSDNRANGFMCTNHKDACPIDDDERRFGIFYCAQQDAADLIRDDMTGMYFPELYDWLRADGYAIVTNFLATFPLRIEMDPARGLQRAPETTSTAEARIASLGMVEQEVLYAVDSGYPGFRGGIITFDAMRGLADRMRKSMNPSRLSALLKTLGYVKHPAFTNKGRPSSALSDGTYCPLYFAKGHALLNEMDVVELVKGVELALIASGPPASNVIPFRR